MNKQYKIRCYDSMENHNVIGVVPYTQNLDNWDGRNWTSGSTGRHIGVGKTKSGEYYVCYGTQWQGERDYAVIISVEEAKQLVLNHRPEKYEEFFGESTPEL